MDRRRRGTAKAGEGSPAFAVPACSNRPRGATIAPCPAAAPRLGGMSEWLKETGCKPVGSAYAGSNPAPSIVRAGARSRRTGHPAHRSGPRARMRACFSRSRPLAAMLRAARPRRRPGARRGGGRHRAPADRRPVLDPRRRARDDADRGPRRARGPEASVVTPNPIIGKVRIWRYSGLRIMFDGVGRGRTVLSVTSTSKGDRTAAGIGVGSREAGGPAPRARARAARPATATARASSAAGRPGGSRPTSRSRAPARSRRVTLSRVVD